MQQADYGTTQQAYDTRDENRAGPGDETLLVKFDYVPVQDQVKSSEEGRPIFKDVEYINIRIPGKRDSVSRPARDMDRNRFPEHYRKFLAREDQAHIEGMPLDKWPGVTRGQVEELRFFNIMSVEQLAAAADNNLSKMMGGQALKERAKVYLEASKDVAASEKLDKANDEIAELRAMVMEMKANKPDVPRGTPKKKRKRRTPAEMAAARAEETAVPKEPEVQE